MVKNGENGENGQNGENGSHCLSARRVQRTKSSRLEGLKAGPSGVRLWARPVVRSAGVRLEVGAQQAPRLLVVYKDRGAVEVFHKTSSGMACPSSAVQSASNRAAHI